MKRRLRIRWFAKWMGAAVCTLICVVWVVSVWWGFMARVGGANFTLRGHGVRVMWSTGRRATARPPTSTFPRQRIFLGEFTLRNSRIILGVLKLPYWIPFSVLAVPTALLFWMDRRRPPPGHCAQCGYNLHGLPEPRCPECGTGFGPKGDAV